MFAKKNNQNVRSVSRKNDKLFKSFSNITMNVKKFKETLKKSSSNPVLNPR